MHYRNPHSPVRFQSDLQKQQQFFNDGRGRIFNFPGTPRDVVVGFDAGLVCRMNYFYEVVGFDAGLVCTLPKDLEVGNPLKGVWKNIPLPQDYGFFITIMKVVMKVVDAFSSPPSFMLLAISYEGGASQLYSSTSNTWAKPLPLPYPDPCSYRHHLLHYPEKKILATYDFECGAWSLMNYDSLKCSTTLCMLRWKDEIIQASHADGAQIKIWKACFCNGMIKWALISEIQASALLAKHGYVAKHLKAAFFIGNIFTAAVSLKKHNMDALLEYDMITGSWEFGGFGHGCPSYGRDFMPSLITP